MFIYTNNKVRTLNSRSKGSKTSEKYLKLDSDERNGPYLEVANTLSKYDHAAPFRAF